MDIIGVPASTLRFWEKEFPGLSPNRTAHNQRSYSAADVELLQIIHYLLHVKGLKLEAAKEYLRHNKKNVSKQIKVIEKLEAAKTELEILLEALDKRIQTI